MEYSLQEILHEVNRIREIEPKFTKRQVLSWYKNGILPPPIREDNTGREAGIVLYFPEEALFRLRSIANYPITKITKTMGLDALAFLLFLFGYNDGELCNKVRSFLLKSADHFNKLLKSIERKNDLGNLIKKTENSYPDTPVELIRAALLKLGGQQKKEVKKLLPQDTSNGIFDLLLTQVQQVIEPIFETANMPFGMAEFFEKYLTLLNKIITEIPSLKEVKKYINNLSQNDFNKLQINLLIVTGFLSKFIVGEKYLNEILKEKIQINYFMGFAISILYLNYIYTQIIKIQKNIYEEGTEMVNQIKEISSKPHEKKKLRKTNKKKDNNY